MIQVPLTKNLYTQTNYNKPALKNVDFKAAFNSTGLKKAFNKSNLIYFTGETQNTTRLDKALEYVKKVRAHNERDIRSLEELDPRQMEGILDGIPVFEGLTVYDLYNMNHLKLLSFERGCKNQCSHCLLEAKAPGGTAKWENIKKLFDGIEEINKRLGFNPLVGLSKHYLPYTDSDPLALQSIDKNGKPHNIAEVQELMYDKTGEMFTIVTAGWDTDQPECKKAAEDLVKLYNRKPDSLETLIISFHPFHKWMTKSIKQTDPARKALYRQKYIDRMTDVFITFLPLIKTHKGKIRLECIPNAPESSPYSEDEALNLFYELANNVYKVCKEKGSESR